MTAPQTPPPRGLYFVLALLFLGCAGLAYWNMQLRRDLAATGTELAQLRARNAPTENRTPEVRVAESETPSAAPVVPEPAPAPAAPRSTGALVAELLKSNPALRDTMARSQAQALERRFADLMDHFQFSPEDRTRFIELLSEKQASATDAALKLVSGNVTAEERAALTQQIKDGNAATDAKIRDFLGTEANNAYYQEYAALQPVRTQVSALQAPFAAAGQPMSEEQANALTGIIYDTRKNFPFTAANPNDNPDPQTALNGPAIDTYFREQELLQGQMADRAAAVLTAEQLAIFRQNQASQLERSKRSLNMAREMFGAGGK